MGVEMGIILIIISLVILILPLCFIILDIKHTLHKEKKPVFEVVTFGIAFFYMAICWLFWEPLPYTDPINLYGIPLAHEPVNVKYLLTLTTISVVSFFCYLFLKFRRKHMSPLIKVFCISGIYGGVALCFVFLFQLLSGARPEGIDLTLFWNENRFYILFLCVLPVIYLIHVAELFLELVKEQGKIQEKIIYHNQFLESCNLFLAKGVNAYWMALIFMLPLYGIVIAVLCLFGQKPDSLIEAFTKTSDWVLSREIAPPPVEYDTHYLCTVALQGHKKLVKPMRYGIRRGEKIVVNRQLCVANAFEQLLEERAPVLHRYIRSFYNKYGYPVSRWITNPWSADIIYLFMKPLEWIFLFFLYLFDEKPENRICKQYLPK